MSDTDEAIFEPTDAMAPTDAIKPWTIKSIASEARDLAVMAARREGRTVGQWLERVIRLATAGEFTVDRQGLPLSDRALTTVGPRKLRSDHDELRELVQMARELSPPDQDTEVMRLARATVRDRLKALRTASPLGADQ